MNYLDDPEPLPVETSPGPWLYTYVCLGSTFLMALALLGRGALTGALIVMLVGAGLSFARWRTGPSLMIITLLWIILADRLGSDPFVLFIRILEGAVSFLAGFARWRLRGFDMVRLGESQGVLDFLLCAGLLLFVAAYCRLLGISANLFPVDRRRRLPVAGSERHGYGRVLEQKRSEALVEPSEAAWLAGIGLGGAAGTLFFWSWLNNRFSPVDLDRWFNVAVYVRVEEGAWRLLVVVWFFAATLLIIHGIIDYLGHRRLTPAEASLYLQDQLWRQTRREQMRINRRSAWGEQELAKKRARHRLPD